MSAPAAERPVSLALIGAGNRGASVYARHAAAQGARFTAVAEADPVRRDAFAALHGVPPERAFAHWRDLLGAGRLADGLIIATPDVQHVEPALAALDLEYRILLEKPIAPDADGVLALAAHAAATGGSITVAHVLRHSPFFSELKRLVAGGAIGDLMSVQHTENIGWWHFAHSFVRGNWRREADASPMILAKACHDLDLLRWLVDADCVSVSSVGGLSHFTPGNAPAGSTDRCTGGCAVERSCPYSAIRIYEEAFGGARGWPISVLSPDPSREAVRAALETGPYGRCVYRSDNDVADHQVVAMLFANGVSASLSVSAFTRSVTRDVHLMGSHGEMRGNMGSGEITLFDFRTRTEQLIRTEAAGDGHAGADQALLADFIARLRGEVTSPALTGLDVSVESHLMAFAAERSRRTGGMLSPGSLRPQQAPS